MARVRKYQYRDGRLTDEYGWTPEDEMADPKFRRRKPDDPLPREQLEHQRVHDKRGRSHRNQTIVPAILDDGDNVHVWLNEWDGIMYVVKRSAPGHWNVVAVLPADVMAEV